MIRNSIIELKESQERLKQFPLEVFEILNKYFDTGTQFKVVDIAFQLEIEMNNAIWVNKIKGIIQMLIVFEYIDLYSLYHGNKNYIYIMRKRINLN